MMWGMSDQPERVRQALEHVCPRCHAPAGIGCARPTGSMLPANKVHKDREDAAARVRDDTGPPADLSTNWARSAWRTYLDTLRERGDVTPGNLRILLQGLRQLEESAAALARASDEPECIGSTGNAIANPQFKVAATCQDKGLNCLQILMLTPNARVGAALAGAAGGEKGDEFDDLDRAASAAAGG